MSEVQNGSSIDVKTCTVFLVGKDLIRDLMEPHREALEQDSMKHYNRVALAIVQIHGKAFGIDIDNVPTPEKWSLGTITKEDTHYMRSFLSVKELMRSEIVMYRTTEEIKLNEGY